MFWQTAPADRDLLPFRNRDTFAHTADDADHDGRAQEALALLGEALWRALVLVEGAGKNVAHRRAGLALEQDEPPRRQLAVIGRARTGGENVSQLGRVGGRARSSPWRNRSGARGAGRASPR